MPKRKTDTAKKGLLRRVRRQRLKYITVLPSLVTILNGVCGFTAIILASKGAEQAIAGVPEGEQKSYFAMSGYMILVAMIADMLDGRLARKVKSTSSFGGQLDSLCDVISFGAAPVFLMLKIVELKLELESCRRQRRSTLHLAGGRGVPDLRGYPIGEIQRGKRGRRVCAHELHGFADARGCRGDSQPGNTPPVLRKDAADGRWRHLHSAVPGTGHGRTDGKQDSIPARLESVPQGQKAVRTFHTGIVAAGFSRLLHGGGPRGNILRLCREQSCEVDLLQSARFEVPRKVKPHDAASKR
ncbi:MAG: CDP-alcohol phosphatidyltransferase family protein [Planctomycetota bacterium]